MQDEIIFSHKEIELKNIIVLVICVLFSVSSVANEADSRQTIQLSEAQRGHVLEEMRAMLSGIQNILNALSNDDMAAVAEHSKHLGMGMAHKSEDHLKDALPKTFMQLGMSVHGDFDQIAADAESRQDSKHTLRQLSKLMNKCVTCHEAYQIRTLEKSYQPDKTDDHK